MSKSKVSQRFKTRLHKTPHSWSLRDAHLVHVIPQEELEVTGITIHTESVSWHYKFPNRFLMTQGDALDVEYKLYLDKEKK